MAGVEVWNINENGGKWPVTERGRPPLVCTVQYGSTSIILPFYCVLFYPTFTLAIFFPMLPFFCLQCFSAQVLSKKMWFVVGRKGRKEEGAHHQPVMIVVDAAGRTQYSILYFCGGFSTFFSVRMLYSRWQDAFPLSCFPAVLLHSHKEFSNDKSVLLYFKA